MDSLTKLEKLAGFVDKGRRTSRTRNEFYYEFETKYNEVKQNIEDVSKRKEDIYPESFFWVVIQWIKEGIEKLKNIFTERKLDTSPALLYNEIRKVRLRIKDLAEEAELRGVAPICFNKLQAPALESKMETSSTTQVVLATLEDLKGMLQTLPKDPPNVQEWSKPLRNITQPVSKRNLRKPNSGVIADHSSKFSHKELERKAAGKEANPNRSRY